VALALVVDDDPTTVPAIRSAVPDVTVEPASRQAAHARVRAGGVDAVVVAATGGDATDALATIDELTAIDGDLAALAIVPSADAASVGAALARLGPLATVEKPVVARELAPRLLALIERRTLRSIVAHRERALAVSRTALQSTTGELAVATARLVEAEKLAAVGRVVTGIAHELSQHLALVGYAEAIKSRVAGDAELAELADVIVTAQKRFAAMVDEIRDFADPSPRDTSREPADLVAVVDEALHLLAYDRDARRRTLVRKWNARPLVALEPGRFSQVVINLVSNAVLATQPGAEIEVAIDATDDAALLAVRDSGVGMPPEVLARIAEPFFTTRGDRGSGLGVGICMRIVEEHGGTLSFASTVGRGTTATVRLPVIPP
jgi:signal transduction histidine kinase